MTTPHVLFDYAGHLPECPTWSEDESALYWTDILEQEIHRYHPASGTHSVLAFPEEVGCFALREQGGFIVAMRHAIWLADKNGLLQRKVCDNPSNTKLARFNDGGTDGDGRFYAGTFWAPGDYNGALLMRIDHDLTAKVIQCDIQGHNGLAFSPDNQWMYTSDTPNGVIYRTLLDKHGDPGKRELFRHFGEGEGLPTARRWIAKGATGARCLTAGAWRVSHRKESSWKSTGCRYVVRRWFALAAQI